MARLSLGYIDEQIDSAVATVDTAIATAKATAIGTAPSGYQTLGAVYDYYVSVKEAQDDLDADLKTFMGVDAANLLPSTYNTLNKMAARISALQTQFDSTDVDASYDTLAEIAAYLVTHSASYASLLSSKVAEDSFRFGSGSFNGDDEGTTTITFTTAFGSNAYKVFITPKASTGYLGDYYVTNKTAIGFAVKNTGTAKTAFDWTAVLASGL